MSHPPTATEVRYAHAILYASVSATTLLIYDSLLSLSNEIHYIWTRRMSYARLIYLCQRYFVLSFLLYFTIDYSGANTLKDSTDAKFVLCSSFPYIFGAAAVASLAFTTGAIVLRIFALWKKSMLLRLVISAGYITVYASAGVFFILAAKQLRHGASYNSYMHMCAYPTNPSWAIGSWICMTVLDVCTFTLIYLSTRNRPDGLGKQTLRPLFFNSAVTAVVNIGLKTINIPVTAIGIPSLTFIFILLVWSCTAVVNARFLLSLYHSHEHRNSLLITSYPSTNEESLKLSDLPPSLSYRQQM